jgi:hypothetical protein
MGVVVSKKELDKIYARYRRTILEVIDQQNHISYFTNDSKELRDIRTAKVIKAMLLEIMCDAWLSQIVALCRGDMEKARDLMVEILNEKLKCYH